MITRRRVLKTLGLGALGALAVPTYAMAEAFADPTITSFAFTPRGWTPGLSLRVAIIADIHACEPWMRSERIASMCARTQALGADIILCLGDFVSSMRLVTGKAETSGWTSALGALTAPLGVHAILGNQDYREDAAYQRDQSSIPVVLSALRKVGIPTYVNEAIRLTKDGHPFWLAGLGDQMALLPGKAYGRKRLTGIHDLDATLAQVTDDAPILLMAHEPDIFRKVPDRVSLTLSGHTHGGQINLFGWRPWSASSGSRRFPAGYFNVEGRELIVSRGLGCSTIPLRLGSPPEIVLLELGTS